MQDIVNQNIIRGNEYSAIYEKESDIKFDA
jgi:hypothetical protein